MATNQRRVVRLLIYEGTEEALQAQLGRSMNEGTRSAHAGIRITCINVSESFFHFCEELGQRVIEQAYLEGERASLPMGMIGKEKDPRE